MRHGWFKIPGVQTGDRTLEEQRAGVERALNMCTDKSVLDLGCAEGLLAREFAMRGAKFVHGIDALGDHLVVAQDICNRYHNISFEQMDLNFPAPLNRQFDIVLALGVAHKLHEPHLGIQFAATHSNDWILVRMTRYATKVLTSKFSKRECNVADELEPAGFSLMHVDAGPREETVHYFRKRQD